MNVMSKAEFKKFFQTVKNIVTLHQAGYPKIASQVLDCLIGPQIDWEGKSRTDYRQSAQGEALFLGDRRCPNKKKKNQKLEKR